MLKVRLMGTKNDIKWFKTLKQASESHGNRVLRNVSE